MPLTPSGAAPAGTPPAEVAIDAELARRLVADQHPDLARLPVTPMAEGWDNVIFRLGHELALRLPRRAAAAPLAHHEQRWLPLLRDRLPLPIPSAVRVGAPQGDYPWSWSIIPWFEGETADRSPLAADQAEVLASFLEALHTPAPDDAPRNPFRGVPLAQRALMVQQRLARLTGRTDLVDDRVRAIWAEALSAPDDAAPTWIHGDPHPRNVLVRDGRITAVIDWGDMAQGDPATDLAAVWMLLPDSDARERAMRACTSVTPATWRRARGWAMLLAVVLLDTGLADNPRMAAIGAKTIQRLVDGP